MSYWTKCPTRAENVLCGLKMAYAGRKCPTRAENVLCGQKMSYWTKCPTRAENVLPGQKMSDTGRKVLKVLKVKIHIFEFVSL